MSYTAIVGGTLYDGTGRRPIPDSSILVGDGRVLNVSRRGEQPLGDGIQVIDVTGTTVLPGLIDAHTHVGELPHNRFRVNDPERLCDRFLRRFTAHGITTIRDTGSPALDDSLRRLKAGRRGWPRIYSSGPNLDGPPGGPWKGLRVVQRPQDARRHVDELADLGADFIKVYVWMTADTVRAVVEAAHAHGLRVAAHAGHMLTVEHATRLGVDAFEHVRVGPELLDEEQQRRVRSLRRRRHDHLMSFRPWRYVDLRSRMVEELIGLLVERGVYLTPTLALSRAILRGNDPAVVDSPAVRQMDEAILTKWRASPYSEDFSEDDWRWAPIELARQLEFVGLAHAHGLRIAAGTDTPNPFVPPGSSLHGELRMLLQAGLSPTQVVHAATQQSARLLNAETQIGTVEKGKVADIVAIARDPFIEGGTFDAIELVMMGGDVLISRQQP